MAPRDIDGVISWVLACPRISAEHIRLVALLNELRETLQSHKFKYTVSMYISVNVELDDGEDGIETSIPLRWLSFEVTANGFVVRTGMRAEVVSEKFVASWEAKAAIAEAINFMAQR